MMTYKPINPSRNKRHEPSENPDLSYRRWREPESRRPHRASRPNVIRTVTQTCGRCVSSPVICVMLPWLRNNCGYSLRFLFDSVLDPNRMILLLASSTAQDD